MTWYEDMMYDMICRHDMKKDMVIYMKKEGKGGMWPLPSVNLLFEKKKTNI